MTGDQKKALRRNAVGQASFGVEALDRQLTIQCGLHKSQYF